MPVTHDMVMHLNQMQEFFRGLSSGSLFPRWHEGTNRGFGAPTTLFYPPAIYYLTSLLFFLARDWMVAIKLLYLIVMAGSGIAIFVLARRFYSQKAALIAMVAYLVAPYHLINLYQRAALAESLSFIWMPLFLLFASELIARTAIEKSAIVKWTLGLALSWTLFILSHPPTAYQFLMIVGPVLVFLAAEQRNLRGLAFIAGGLCLAFMLASIYLLPAFVEQGFVHADDVEHVWPYHESYVWYTSSNRYDHLGDDFVRRIDWIWFFSLAFILLSGLSWLLIQRFRRQDKRIPASWFWPWFGAGMLAIFMMHPTSRALGGLIPRIEIGVFAWRILAITTLVISLLVGYLAEITLVGGACLAPWKRRYSSFVVVVVLVGSSALSLTLVILPMYRAEAFVPRPQHSNYALVPIAGARDQEIRPAVISPQLNGQVDIERWDPEHRSFVIELRSAAEVSIRTFNFPGWTAKANDVPAEIRTGPAGEILLDLPAGRHRVYLDFVNTRIRTLGVLITLVGLGIIGVVLAAHYLRRPDRIGG